MSNWRSTLGGPGAVGDSSMESDDWRTQLQADSRQRIVNMIMDTLKKHIPFSGHKGLQELKKIAVRFEEKIYIAATSQSDYVEKISLKMQTMETKSQNLMSDITQANSAATSVDPSYRGSQVMQQVNNQGQKLPIPMSANHLQQGQQLLSQTMQHNISSTRIQGSSGLSSALPTVSGLPQSTMAKSVLRQHRQLQHRPQIHTNLMGVQQANVRNMQQNQMLPKASSTSLDSTTHTSNPNGDWQEEVYRKIKTMKDLYLLDLNGMHQKILDKLQQHDSLPQLPKNEQLEKLKVFKNMLGCLMAFLQIPKQNILADYKDKLGTYEKQIISVINLNRRKPAATQQQSQQTHLQLTQVQPLENQTSSQMLSVNIQGSVAAMQEKNMGNLQQNSVSSPPGASNSQQNMTNSILPSSNLDPGQNSSTSGPQKVNMNPMVSHSGMGTLQPNSDMLNIKQQEQLLQSHQSKQFQQCQMQQQFLPPSPQIDQQNLFKSLNKGGTPLQSANSPFTVPFPSTPSASPIQPELIGVSLNVVGHQQPAAALPTQSLAICTPGILGSPSAMEQPLECLLKAVKSISPKALSASVSDIGSVVSMIDRIAGSAPDNGSRAAVGEDLVAMTNCHLHSITFVNQDGTSGMRKLKRFISEVDVVSSTGSLNDSFKQFTSAETSELDSTASPAIKRPRIETSHSLMEEINEINQGLVDTVVDINEEDDDKAAASEGCNGTIVKCSFNAVALGSNLKSQYASAQMSPIQPLRLLVPANYPNCSPILLDKFPVEVSKEYEELSIKAKPRLSVSLRSLSEPMSLGDIARAWDVCARAVISEYAQQSGGGTFSSKYGTWEDCITTQTSIFVV